MATRGSHGCPRGEDISNSGKTKVIDAPNLDNAVCVPAYYAVAVCMCVCECVCVCVYIYAWIDIYVSIHIKPAAKRESEGRTGEDHSRIRIGRNLKES